MATDVFHMDANGVRISAHRAVFGEHAYAPRNISGVERVEDKGVRWPGMSTLVLGFVVIAVGFIMQHTITVMIGAVAVLSGSLNLGRKRPKFGIRIMTQRGPVYVLASLDKRYVEVVSEALLRAVSAAHLRGSAQDESGTGGEPRTERTSPTGAPQPRRSGRPTPRRRRR